MQIKRKSINTSLVMFGIETPPQNKIIVTGLSVLLSVITEKHVKVSDRARKFYIRGWKMRTEWTAITNEWIKNNH